MIEKNKFEIVLQTISTGLVGRIMEELNMNEDDAMVKLYSSELYSVLEREDTKVWHYSVPMLFELYKQETTTGKLTLPDY